MILDAMLHHLYQNIRILNYFSPTLLILVYVILVSDICCDMWLGNTWREEWVSCNLITSLRTLSLRHLLRNNTSSYPP